MPPTVGVDQAIVPQPLYDLRMRILALAVVVSFVGCAETPTRPRTLDDFLAASAREVKRIGVQRASGLDPVGDWALMLSVERGAMHPEGQEWTWPLFVNEAATLQVEEARALSGFAGGRLFLGGLRTLDAEVAEALSGGHHELYLDGLSQLDAETAKALVSGAPKRLSLCGLRDLDVETAKELARLDGSLHLDGLARPELDVVRALAEWAGWGEQVIMTLGVVDPTSEHIEAMRGCRGWGLGFPRIETMTPAMARAFAAVERPSLSFNGLEELSDETAAEIGRWRAKFLDMDRLREATDVAVRDLRRGSQALSVRSLSNR